MFFVIRRATLLIPSGSADEPSRKHLFICATDAVGPNNETLLVSVSSIKPKTFYDQTCPLYPGDHPFIQRDSYVSYRHSRIEPAKAIINGVKTGDLVPMDPLETAIFARICNGITTSRFTAKKILDFYIEYSK